MIMFKTVTTHTKIHTMLLFALGLASSQSRFPASSPLVCSIGLTESMSSEEPGKRRDAWRHVASRRSRHRRWDYIPSLFCSYRSLWVYNIRILTARGMHVPSLIGCGKSWSDKTFPGSRHLANYCADSGSECSLSFSISASTCRWSTLDILWQPVAILRASLCIYWMFQ